MSGKEAAIGAAFESQVEWSLAQYANTRRCRIFRMGVRARFTTRDGRTMVIPEASMPDYVGALAGGRLIAFDAKTTANKTRWSHPRARAHQLRILAELRSMGAIAFFMLEAREFQTVYIVPVEPAESYTHSQLWGQENALRVDIAAPDESIIMVESELNGNYAWLDPLLRQWPDA